MHTLFFGVKRLHLRIVESTRRILQPDSLTPARFDLMRAIAARDGEQLQRNLQYLFGVSAVTISRMVKGLEEKGFVVRRPLEHDRRFKRVIITPTGHQALARDMAYLVRSRVGEYLAAALVSSDRYADIDSASVRRRVERSTDRLVRGRRILRDRSPVRHAWSTHDFATMGSIALEHESNPHPLRRRRRRPHNGTPLAWETLPPHLPSLAKAQPRPQMPRRGRIENSRLMHADLFGDFDRRHEETMKATQAVNPGHRPLMHDDLFGDFDRRHEETMRAAQAMTDNE